MCACAQVRQWAECGPGGGAEREEPEGETGPRERHADRRHFQPPAAAGGLCLCSPSCAAIFPCLCTSCSFLPGNHSAFLQRMHSSFDILNGLFLPVLTVTSCSCRTRTWRCVRSTWNWTSWRPSCRTSTPRNLRMRHRWPRSFLSFQCCRNVTITTPQSIIQVQTYCCY